MPLPDNYRNHKIIPPRFENLEERLLLTTMYGGDTFEYKDAADNTIRVVLEGDIIAEFIAADFDPNTNSLILGDIPGRVYGPLRGGSSYTSGDDLFGGVGGADGVELLGTIDITDSNFNSGTGYTISWNAEGVDDITLQALASMDAENNGDTYAFNIATVDDNGTERTLVQLLKINTVNGDGDVQSLLQQASLRDDIMSSLSSSLGDVQAMAIDPTTGTGYAINEESGTGSVLYSINRYTGLVTSIGTLTNSSTTNTLSGVKAMAFDSTGQLYIITQDYDGDSTTDTSTLAIDADSNTSNFDVALVAVDKTTAQFANSDATSITVGTFEVTVDFNAMAFDSSDNLFAISQASGESITSTLYAINSSTGASGSQSQVKVGEDGTKIDGLAFTTNFSGTEILVGTDNLQIDSETSVVQPRLVSILTGTGAAVALSEAGAVAQVNGLASYTEAGDSRPLLFATDGTNVLRGSAVSLPLDEGATNIAAISAADFRPQTGASDDNLLFFVARDGDDADILFSIDVTKPSMSAIQNSLTRIGTINSDSEYEVTSIAWDQTSASAATLKAFRKAGDDGQIVILSTTNGSASSVVNVTMDEEAITDISAIEFVNDNTSGLDTYIYAVDNGGDQLLRITTSSGFAYVLGPLSDPDDTDDGPVRGEDLHGLSWHPTLMNPFTGDQGVLLASDASSDEVVYVDHRERFPSSDVYAIYITQTSDDASITMAVVPDFDPDDPTADRVMTPFSGSTGNFKMTLANDPDGAVVAPGGSGGVYIGARYLNDDNEWVTVVSGDLSAEEGVRPAGLDDFLSNSTKDLSAGVVVGDNLLNYVDSGSLWVDRLLGQNLDDVQEIAVGRNGSIVVVDTDGVDENGDSTGDQIAVVDGSSGEAEKPISITDSVTGLNLSGIQGLDYGDVDFDGTEELFAILNANSFTPASSVGGDLGGDFDIVGLTVDSGGTMYAIDDDSGAGTSFKLYKIERSSAGAVTAFTPTNGYEIQRSDASGAVTGISALTADPVSGQLYAVGLDPTSGNQTLYTISKIASDVDGDGTADDVAATEVVELDDANDVLGNGAGAFTETIEALAFSPDGSTLYAVIKDGTADTLFTVNTTTGDITQVDANGVGGAIEIASVGTDLEEIDFFSAGVLVGYDKSGGAGSYKLVKINLFSPSASTAISSAGSMDDNLLGFASDSDGLFYSVYDDNSADNEVYVSAGATATLGTIAVAESLANYLPSASVGNGIVSGTLTSPQALTITSSGTLGTMYLIDSNGTGYDLYSVSRQSDGSLAPTSPVTLIGEISDSSGNVIDKIYGIEADPGTGTLYVIGEDSAGDMALFTLATDGSEIDGTAGDEVLATSVGKLDEGSVTDDFVALAFNSTGSVLYTVRNDGGTYKLYAISKTTAILTLIGDIEVASTAVDVISAMDSDENNNLIAIEGNAGSRRLIEIDVTDPTSSTEVTAAATVSDNFAGYAYGPDGKFYTINDDPNDTIWSSDEFASGVFTAVGAVEDSGGTAVSGVRAMAFKQGEGSISGQQGLYIIDTANELFEVDPTTGQLQSLVGAGLDVEDSSGTAVIVGSMDFDQNDNLYAHDTVNGRLVDLVVSTGVAGGTVATADGSIRPTVGAISFDFANSRFLAVDNATSLSQHSSATESAALMSLEGLTNTTATGQNIDKVFVGGTVTGKVDTSGSVGTFYGGWIITGASGGQADTTATVSDNFNVEGDIRNLVTVSSLGTDTGGAFPDPRYVCGFDMQVGGKIGQIWTMDSYRAVVQAENQDNIVNLSSGDMYQYELEGRVEEPEASDEGIQFEAFRLLRSDEAFYNDTFETAQYVGSVRTGTLGDDDVIRISGTLYSDEEEDLVDFYGISLLAGQTITVQFTGAVEVGVYDPDGRLIAGSFASDPFRITTDRPGVFRFSVAPIVDGNTYPYTLSIDDIGDIGVGGVVVASNFYNNTSAASVLSERGDVGGIYVGGDMTFNGTTTDVQADDGNIRSIEAGTIGAGINDASFGVNIIASGSIGLLHTTSSYMNIESANIGGDLQVADAAGTFYIDLTADGGVGVIRAADMASDETPSAITVNRDNVGSDGIIDLIDLTGDLGTLRVGGPAITTGIGGNVRYMQVGGTVYQDLFFGGGSYGQETVPAGQEVTIEDDSGGSITLTPVVNSYNQLTGAPVDTPSLTYRAYGIRGSGGKVIIDVTSTGGINVSGDGHGNSSYVEIGEIIANGGGRAVEVQADGSLALAEDAGTNLSVTIDSGGCVVDVFQITGGNFSEIINHCSGEIVNITADSIGTLESYGDIGLARNHTGAEVNQIATLFDLYPYEQEHIGVVSGNIALIKTKKSVGNVIVSSAIGEVYANYNRPVNHADGEFNGIEGVILALGADGNIGTVHIGEGLAPSGTGKAEKAAIIAEGSITKVVNQGLGSDIRGNILGERGIDRIELINGSIIDAGIWCFDLTELQDEEAEVILVTGDIGEIYLEGKGGIIGSRISALDIGDICVSNGFGIFTSTINSTGGTSKIGNIWGGGFGIRTVFVDGGASVGNITAGKWGEQLSSLSYSDTVRYSENYTYDPLFNQYLTTSNDIHKFLGTSLASPNATCGIIANLNANAFSNLGHVVAYQINDSDFDFANHIAGLMTRGGAGTSPTMSNVEITTGSLGYFKPGALVTGLNMNIAGVINNITINGDFGSWWDGSSVTAYGPNGYIKYFRVTGNMYGDLTSSGIIGTVIIDGNLSGNITASSTNPRSNALNKLTIGGSYLGTLDITGNAGIIEAARDFGSAGDALLIDGNLKALKVGTNKTVNGSSLGLDINVTGNLYLLDVTGQSDGAVFVGGDLTKTKITADSATTGTAIVNGDLTVLGSLKYAYVTGGNVAANVTVGDDVKTFKIVNGDLVAGTTLTSSLGNIYKLDIRNGDLLGNVMADNGTIDSILVLGSDIGAAASISAEKLKKLQISGSILSGATIAIVDELTYLQVGADIQASATVTAGSGKKVKVLNDMLGTFTYGYGSAVNMAVSRNLGGTLTIDSDTKLTVGGNISSGGTVSIGRDLTNMTVTGTVAGDVFVDGSGNTWKVGALNNAVLTTGLNLKNLTVNSTVTNSLFQAGVSRGDDSTFNTDDLNETGRMGNLYKLAVRGAMSGSVFAAGGGITNANITGGMTNSSISTGLCLGNAAIATVIADATPLGDAAERNAARMGSDLEVYCGDFKTAIVGAAGLVNSDLTAGIDPGSTDGAFGTADDSVSSSVTGGSSKFNKVQTAVDVNSTVLADGGITRNVTSGAGTVTANVTYALGDITSNNALETLVATATNGLPATYVTTGGHTVTVTITGNGSVALRDEAGADSDNKIDTLVISGTDSRSKIAITTTTPGAVTIGRIITADDAQFHTLTFDGDLVGDGSDDQDLWLDGPVNTFTFRDMGDSFNGQIGGDARALTLQTQGSSKLRVGGKIRTLTITDSGTDPLLTGLGAPGAGVTISSMAIDSNPVVYVFNSASSALSSANLATGALSGTVTVTDAFGGTTLTLAGMDFDGSDVMYAVADVYNQSPTKQLGSISGSAISGMSGLAANRSGEVYAIQTIEVDSVDYDYLVKFDVTAGSATLGAASPVGRLKDIFNNTYSGHVDALAFDVPGNLYGIVSDQNGSGTGNAGAALVKIETSDSNSDGYLRVTSPTNSFLPGTLLDDGGIVTDSFMAMAVHYDDSGLPATPAVSTIYAIRRNGGEDHLVTIGTDGTTDAVAAGNLVQIDPGSGLEDTNIVGMGFDSTGLLANVNLIAFNSDGSSAEMINLDVATPASSTLITAEDALDPTLDAFAVGMTGSQYPTYAYDNDSTGILYTNPGTMATLGTVNTSTGVFTRLQGLATDATGTPLGSTINILGVAVDNAGTGDVFVLTDDTANGFGLLRYDDANGDWVSAIGNITDANTGDTLNVTSIEFDDTTGSLIGLDSRFNQLVTISTTDATATPRVESGSADGTDMTALAYDSANTAWYSFSSSTGTGSFMQFRGIDQSDLGGITASSIDKFIISGTGYGGRVVTTGNTVKNVSVTGNFYGSLISHGSIVRYTQTGGNFSGVIKSEDDVKDVRIIGGFLSGGSVESQATLNRLTQSGGNFGGFVSAQKANTIKISGAGQTTADINVTGYGKNVTLGSYNGEASFGSVSKLRVGGQAGANADIDVLREAKTIQLSGGTAAGSSTTVDGYTKSLTVGGTHRGTVAIRRGMGSGRMAAVISGLLVVGDNTKNFSAGSAYDSVFSFGTWIGSDGTYNSADDVITGGTVNSATFSGVFQDSAILAGVLPRDGSGDGIPTDDMLLFSGNDSASSIIDVDSAEAGGILKSTIKKLNMRGRIDNNDPSNGACSVAAAADGITKLRVSNQGAYLTTRDYTDDFYAPTVVSATKVNDGEARIVFSEQINTSTLVLSIDADDDGSVTGIADTNGTVRLVDNNGDVVDDAVLSYTTQISDTGDVQGVLIIRRSGGLPSSLTVTLSGGTMSSDTIMDRSSSRSALRDMNQNGTAATGEDVPGTILDGDGDGVEGGDYVVLFGGDAGDTFLTATPVSLTSGGSWEVFNTLASASDVDVYSFTATAYEFLSVNFVGDPLAAMSVFYRDDQGTSTVETDDYFEALARAEEKYSSYSTLFQAFELPETGTYYVAVTTKMDSFNLTDDQTYTLELHRATSDTNLVSALGGSLPGSEEIGYVSNTVNANNNALGANTPTQLVYLNFDGGTTTEFTTDVTVDAFDLADIDSGLDGYETTIIDGGTVSGTTVTGIVDNIMSIFTNTPSSHPAGAINVQQITTLAEWTAATEGLFFTTVDPSASWGLNAQADFTTIFIGKEETKGAGALGVANTVDLCGQSKADNAIVFAQNFEGYATASSTADKLNQYSRALANTAAHEVGHTIGLEHQPIDFVNYTLLADDPDNSIITVDDSNQGVGLMAYKPTSQRIGNLNQLGTARLGYEVGNDQSVFPIGWVDNVDQLLRWFS